MADEGSLRHELEAQRRQIPGCGFGLYALILLVFFLVGATGITMSTLTILDASRNASPFNLTYGGNVEPALLLPMRAAGLLADGEVPDAFHPETVMGDRACAIHQDTLMRVDGGQGVRLPLAEVDSVELIAEGVRAAGAGTTIECHFNEGEGADRFAKMIEPRR